jgi:hypothetical protein
MTDGRASLGAARYKPQKRLGVNPTNSGAGRADKKTGGDYCLTARCSGRQTLFCVTCCTFVPLSLNHPSIFD